MLGEKYGVKMGRLLCLVVGSMLCVGQTGCAWKQRITFVKKVENIDIQMQYVDNIFYKTRIRNNTKNIVKLIWDESVFITTTGDSTRLLRGKTKVRDTAKTQPTSPFAPNSYLEEYFGGELLYRRLGVLNLCGRFKPKRPENQARVLFTFEIDGKKEVAEMAIRFYKD